MLGKLKFCLYGAGIVKIMWFCVLYAYLFIYTICHEQNKYNNDKIKIQRQGLPTEKNSNYTEAYLL